MNEVFSFLKPGAGCLKGAMGKLYHENTFNGINTHWENIFQSYIQKSFVFWKYKKSESPTVK